MRARTNSINTITDTNTHTTQHNTNMHTHAPTHLPHTHIHTAQKTLRAINTVTLALSRKQTKTSAQQPDTILEFLAAVHESATHPATHLAATAHPHTCHLHALRVSAPKHAHHHALPLPPPLSPPPEKLSAVRLPRVSHGAVKCVTDTCIDTPSPPLRLPLLAVASQLAAASQNYPGKKMLLNHTVYIGVFLHSFVLCLLSLCSVFALQTKPD